MSPFLPSESSRKVARTEPTAPGSLLSGICISLVHFSPMATGLRVRTAGISPKMPQLAVGVAVVHHFHPAVGRYPQPHWFRLHCPTLEILERSRGRRGHRDGVGDGLHQSAARGVPLRDGASEYLDRCRHRARIVPRAWLGAGHFHRLRQVHSERVANVWADLKEYGLTVGCLSENQECEKNPKTHTDHSQGRSECSPPLGAAPAERE
jgi:hypothetical protein